MSKKEKRTLQPLKNEIAKNSNSSNDPNLNNAQTRYVSGKMVNKVINSYEHSMKRADTSMLD